MGDGGGSASEVNTHKTTPSDVRMMNFATQKSAEKCRARCSRLSVNGSLCGVLVRQVFPLKRELLGGGQGYQKQNKRHGDGAANEARVC